MLKLKIISLFLAMVLSIQMLPFAQIGYALGSNQWTEELPHGNTSSDKSDTSHSTHSFLPAAVYTVASAVSGNIAMLYIHFSLAIPSNHSTDVVSPPPDVLA